MRTAIALFSLALGVAQAAKPVDGYFVASDGVKIHYLTLGRRGSWVVLIHGFTGNADGNWFLNGIAQALADSHRVVAIDCRGHGLSDKPEDPAKYGPGRMELDVVEMMDHLKIKRAHIHGYSMGGAITGQLLAHHPDRIITAAFGGSGIREVDPAWVAKVPKDVKGKDELEDQASKDLAAAPNRDEKAFAAIRKATEGQPPLQIDLTNITTPILAINGEFDSPNAKTARMKRELQNFKNVVLPGKSHLTAIMAGYMPDEYLKTLVEFIDSHDE
ncbi:MAG TPA: alpha/beta hydrolase [Bryobacteraceae bacterium]|nr:alpha/beta hydrolase [Bryobacteraceae bacterium]